MKVMNDASTSNHTRLQWMDQFISTSMDDASTSITEASVEGSIHTDLNAWRADFNHGGFSGWIKFMQEKGDECDE